MDSKLRVSLGKSLTISKSEGWHWYPSLRKMNDNSLLLVFSVMADALPENIVTPHHVMLRSTDRGSSWYFHRYLYFPTTVAGDAHVCAQLSNGTVLELPNNIHVVGDEEFYAPMWKSNDNGKTFSGPYNARLSLPIGAIATIPAMGRTLADIRFYRSVIELDNGHLLASMYGRFKGDEKYRSFLVKSTDHGENWSYLSPIAYDPKVGTEGFCEPVMALLPDGNILCIMRTGSGGPLYQTKSEDKGETWSKPEPTGANGVDPDLIVLSDGTLACSYGRLDPKLPSNGDSIMFSTDGGLTWTDHTLIYPGPSTGYTGIEEIRPNQILYAFDTLGFGWTRYNTIRVTSVKVDRE